MERPANKVKQSSLKLEKCQTGVSGLDEVTFGGLPKGRPTLVCGGAGCGKTILAMEFLYRGAFEFNEPGVFMAFEERENDLKENFSSMGFELQSLIKQKKLYIDYVYIERSEVQETGEYDLEALFVRLGSAIDSIKAKRVVLDTVEALFSGFSNEVILRAELRRLFRWLKERGVTTIVTGEKGKDLLTRYGLEEYVADCVIYLDHRVNDQIATRRIKIIKYRGSGHGTNEFPFLIGETGIAVFPITSLLLKSPASDKKISSGIKGLDEMLDNNGYYIGSSILVSGMAGSGKTSFAAQFANETCRNGKKVLFISFEEAESQILRNMKNIGLNLDKYIKKNLLKIIANRGTFWGLEMHLVMTHKEVNDFKPEAVIIDPISTLGIAGTSNEAKAMLARLLDFLKNQKITVIATDLDFLRDGVQSSGVNISSLCDIWIKLTMETENSKKVRKIAIIKSRGIKHDYETKNLIITGKGLEVK